ncbi:hypothetical protein IWQ62_003080 [Dispira parvispora]|uniref:Uncharacterized protein n=1 Tax=Dispira parvispora TaxID=1520584 RepID=A0A9W8E6L4_9FUNG|nr:hypothetical protein IWQ62_003080 [Dispira parvispora]
MGNEQAKPTDPAAEIRHRALTPMDGVFRKGIRHNLKIVIRGDTMTGKTALFQRLQGISVTPDYAHTEQIQVANIKWDRNNASEVVKIELWDVVDRSERRRTLGTNLKLSNDATLQSPQAEASSEPVSVALDADTINVYRDCNCVLLLFDITKRWTFEYALQELDRIPYHITTLLVGNFAHQAANRTVSVQDIRVALAHNYQRRHHAAKQALKERARYTLSQTPQHGEDGIRWDQPPDPILRYTECDIIPHPDSPRHTLDHFYEFLNIPLLALQVKEWIQKVRLCQQDLKNQLSAVDCAEFSGLDLEWETIRETPIETIPSKEAPKVDGQPLDDQEFYSSSEANSLASPASPPQQRLSVTHTPDTRLTALGESIDDSFFDDVDNVVQSVNRNPILPSSAGDEPRPHPMVTLDEDFEISPEVVPYSTPSFLGKSTQGDMSRTRELPATLPSTPYRSTIDSRRNLVSPSKTEQAQGPSSATSEPAPSRKSNSLPNSLPVTPDEELQQHNPWSFGAP